MQLILIPPGIFRQIFHTALKKSLRVGSHCVFGYVHSNRQDTVKKNYPNRYREGTAAHP